MKILKIFFILSIVIAYMFWLNIPYVQAEDIGESFEAAQDFINIGNSDNALSDDKIGEMSDTLYNMIFVVGVVLAVGIGIFIGIQFMTSGVEQKAKIKETLIAYVAGCIVVFGAFGIWKLVVEILQSST